MTEEEYFRKNYPNSCYGDKPLSPHWDFFQDGVEFGERQSEKRIEELEAQKNWLEGCKSELGEHLGKANDRIVELETTCNKWFEHLKNREEELLNELNNQNAKYNKQITEVEQEVKLWKKASENNSYKAFQLKQENAELKAVERMALYSKMSDRLAKAKELLKRCYDTYVYEVSVRREIEQFIREVEK